MTTTTPSKPPSPSTSMNQPDLIHYVSWGALIVCPIVALLPPRKLDFYTVGLLGGTFLGGNQISREYTGISMVQRIVHRANSWTDARLPPKAMEAQRRLKEEKEARMAGVELGRRKEMGVLAEVQREKERVDRGLLEKVWMGSEGEDWKAKRDQREKEALDEGRGYGGLIMDQIWEVWNWGKDKNEEAKEVDEKVVAEKKSWGSEEKKR
ncbi:uncharacterized protein LY89DRAFT_689984 [Mollisia scopiformis]|uniref:Rhomboid family membrane protein n=1 Tax=Mollisia scopiformis TaxID=149040 RepID=A0A132BEA3_MOLSC|nr:uncharacterized protein LY89DRAFT_689984 [Mollisia scopiformis]KUJ10174.1 hypothetical protein LY89DRAFT_689984 [Mollisia scopiformis]